MNQKIYKPFSFAGFIVLTLLFFLFHTHPLVAQQGLTPEQVSKIQTVTSAAISEDGNYVAYTVSKPANPREENRPNQTHLYVLNTETGESKPYYSRSGIGDIAFRPGHDSITFLATQDGDVTRSLYELPIHGGEAVKIFSFNSNIIDYVWDSHGHRIAFTAPERLPESRTELPYSPEIFEENLPNRKAYVTNVSEGDRPNRIRVDGTVYLLSWSPDGSQIAVSAAPTPHIDDYYMYQQVFIADSESGELLSEINNEGKIGQIVWSPDGDRLALRAGRDINDPIDGRILIVNARGGVPQIINPDFEGKYEQIAWAESNRIHFLASEGVERSFGTIRPDGNQKEYILSPGGPILGSFDQADNGNVAFTGNTNTHPNEVFLLEEDQTQVQRMTTTNSWLDDVEMGRQEVVTYTARDGEFEIEGMLIYPTGYNEGERIPVITMVHGGPEAHYSNGWLNSYSMPGQMAAEKGYGVFYPNYRGSTGRGVEFIHSSQGDLAGKEFDDVVDGVDYLVDQGVADPDRIGVTGGSYGGYASAWMATYYSEKFAASVMFVGISNNLSKWGTSDIPDELYLVHSRERMWESDEKWMDYLKRSPIYWVDRAQTPILIMHGSEDTRVHPGQSLELYRHLKVRRPEVPVRLVFYPNEGHGNVNSSSRYDYTLRMFRWFDTYLMSGDASAEIPDREVALPKSDEEQFFNTLSSHCGATFKGEGDYPDDPDDELIDIPLTATIETCTDDEIRIPFHAGDDRSRTWIISKTDQGLLLKHDHRDPETGEEHDLTNYGGYATTDGTANRQFFAADEDTIEMLPEAATNVWMMEIDIETGEFTYYLERHRAPRFRAELEMQ